MVWYGIKETFSLMMHSTHIFIHDYMVIFISINRQENTSCGALAGMTNSSMDPLCNIIQFLRKTIHLINTSIQSQELPCHPDNKYVEECSNPI